jgi:hypothetical protein
MPHQETYEETEAKIPRDFDLTVVDRLQLASLLPEEGNYKTIKRTQALRERLNPGEAEQKELGIIVTPGKTPGQLTWTWTNAELANTPTRFSFEDDEIAFIIKALVIAEKENRLKIAQIKLYEMFCTNLPELGWNPQTHSWAYVR